MLAGTWPNQPGADEYAVSFDGGRSRRVLLIPALFGEANKMRRFTVQTMRALDREGFDSFLPDLPGTGESLHLLSDQSLASWRAAMENGAQHFRATHVVTIRGGCLCGPPSLPRMSYAPLAGASIMRALVRMHMISEREAGRGTSSEELDQTARAKGVWVGGYDLRPQLYQDIIEATAVDADQTLAASDLGGPGLWLRAEPGEAPDQSQRFANLIAEWAA